MKAVLSRMKAVLSRMKAVLSRMKAVLFEVCQAQGRFEAFLARYDLQYTAIYG
jgi:hypothetical protein